METKNNNKMETNFNNKEEEFKKAVDNIEYINNFADTLKSITDKFKIIFAGLSEEQKVLFQKQMEKINEANIKMKEAEQRMADAFNKLNNK